jgi:UDP-N-acetylmuramoylalanine--D-glutamate ligase
VLNVTPDHMDRYEGMAQYAAAKAAIFARCGTAVLNADDEFVSGMGASALRRVRFSLSRPADYCLTRPGDEEWLTAPDGPVLAVRELRLRGRHNAANALAALALGDACGIARDAMVRTLREFAGLAHRAVVVRERRGVTYIDDSKGTNVGATLAAVAGMQGPLVVIAGGDGKQQDFGPLAPAFRGKVRRVLLIGRDARELAAALHGICELEFCATLEQAVAAAARTAQPGDTVLLSPACASLDMFRDYGHRGDVFTEAVRSLPE